MLLQGKVWKFGDDIDTDAIIPARYLNTSNHAELAQYVMEDAVAGFSKQVSEGDIFVAGKNFGCGSSREHAPIAIKAAGVSCVIADSFARIFFRNSFNIGLPIFESKEAAAAIAQGDQVEVNTSTGVITNVTTGKTYQAAPIPDFMQELISSGGLMNYIKNKKM
ncbi:MAG: 3-isopropylmalate dehydratase small subunit [Tissierellia bacterium]|nr:3-isopropylmalate dehydratase small subunit [Tissierellia bacterium]